MPFAFVQNLELREIVERDYSELSKLNAAVAPKSVLVLSGCVMEGILLDALVVSGKWTLEEGSKKFLSDMIGPAKASGIISEDRLSDVVRKYRNVIHPGREFSLTLKFSEADASLARSAVEILIREVQNWEAKTKGRTPNEKPTGATLSMGGIHERSDTQPVSKVYYARCGATTGKPSNCVGYSNHSFTSAKTQPYCVRCGKTPGKPSSCIGYQNHSFTEADGPVYCVRCGHVPGEGSECVGYQNHSFTSG